MCVLIKKKWKNWKLLTISWPVGFISAVGECLIGNKGKHNRPDNSVSNLLTDLHANPVSHEMLTFRVPWGSRNLLAFSVPSLNCYVQWEQSASNLCAAYILQVFLHPASIALTAHGWRMADHVVLQQGRTGVPEICSHAFVAKVHMQFLFHS